MKTQLCNSEFYGIASVALGILGIVCVLLDRIGAKEYLGVFDCVGVVRKCCDLELHVSGD